MASRTGSSGRSAHLCSFERNNNNNGSRFRDLGPRGHDQEEENNGTPPSAEECAQFIQTLLSGLSASDAQNETDEHNKLLEYLGQIISATHSLHNGGEDQMSTMPSSAPPPPQPPSYSRAIDRRRGRAHDRNRMAQDAAVASLNYSSFVRRFPQTRNIKLSGNGR
jgi:hypothetical protein